MVTARQGDAFARVSDHEYVLDPGQEAGFRELAASVCAGQERLAGVVGCLSTAALSTASGTPTDLDTAAKLWLLAPMRLAYAFSRQLTVRPLPILIVTAGTARVCDADVIDPARALSAGIARVLPQEHPGLRLAHIDVDGGEGTAEMLAAELSAGAPEPAVAIRGKRRFTERFESEAIRLTKAPLNLPTSPVVLITGGLGHMGLHLAEALFAKVRAKLVLMGRSALPDPVEWAAVSEAPTTPPQQKTLLARLAKLKAERDDVLVLAADMNDGAKVKAAVDAAFERFGGVDLVVHGAAPLTLALSARSRKRT